MGSSVHINWMSPFIILGFLIYFFLPHFIVFVVNFIQTVPTVTKTPHFAASDLGLHCLPISFHGTLGINSLTTRDENR